MTQDTRHAGRVPCDIILNKIEEGHTHVCRAINISLGGMRLQRLLEPLDHRERRVRLQFELPGASEPIWVGARRVYQEDDCVGLTFTYISHQHFLALRQWISSVELAA